MTLDNTLGNAPTSTTFLGAVNIDGVKGITSSTWNAKTGGISHQHWEGTQAQMINGANQCQTLGYEYELKGGAVWTLDVTYPVDIIINSIGKEPQPITVWELSYQQIEQNIYNAKDRFFIGALTPDDILDIEQKIRNPLISSPPNDWGSARTVAKVAYDLKVAGVEGKILFVPVLKRTAIISSQYDISKIGWNNGKEGMLFTTGELTAPGGPISVNPATVGLNSIPPSIYNQLPQVLNVGFYSVDGAFFQIPAFGPVYDAISQINTFVGWLQYPIEIQTLTLQKVQATQSWVFNQWSFGDYGLYDAANPTNQFVDPSTQVAPMPGGPFFIT